MGTGQVWTDTHTERVLAGSDIPGWRIASAPEDARRAGARAVADAERTTLRCAGLPLPTDHDTPCHNLSPSLYLVHFSNRVGIWRLSNRKFSPRNYVKRFKTTPLDGSLFSKGDRGT